MGGRIRPRDLNPRVSPDEPTLVSPPCMTGARTISETTLKTARLVTKTVLFSTLVVAVVGSTLAIAQRDDFAFFDPLMDVKGAIDRFYLEEPDQKALQTGAIEGMIATLNDPYTVFVPARERREFDKELTGEYVGIGAQIQIRDGWLTIASPLEDSPAYRVGLMADDKVVKINGESTFGLTDEQCVEKLTGEPGTTVTLTIERKGEELELTIKREPIKTRSVKGFHRDPTDAQKWQSYIDPARKIVYLRLTQFTPNCSLEVAEALRQAGADKGDVKGLILDVRWNGGGVLQDAIAIADMFLNDGVIVSTKGRSHPEEVARAEAPGTLPDFPIAVLVNAQSASGVRGSRRCARRERPGRRGGNPHIRKGTRADRAHPAQRRRRAAEDHRTGVLPALRTLAAPQGATPPNGASIRQTASSSRSPMTRCSRSSPSGASRTSFAAARPRVNRIGPIPTRSSRSSRIVRWPRRCARSRQRSIPGSGSRPVGRCRVVASRRAKSWRGCF
jgi:C-terminal peptidase prc